MLSCFVSFGLDSRLGCGILRSQVGQVEPGPGGDSAGVPGPVLVTLSERGALEALGRAASLNLAPFPRSGNATLATVSVASGLARSTQTSVSGLPGRVGSSSRP